MRLRWQIAGITLLLLVVAYAIACWVTEQHRNDAQAAFQAAIERTQAALEERHVAEPPRTPIGAERAWDLMAPFGQVLIQDPAWNEFSSDIGTSVEWTETSLADARTWLEGHALVLAGAREVADLHIALDPDISLDKTTLSPRQFVEAGRLLLLSAIVAMDDGNSDAAFDDLTRALEIADTAGTPRLLIWKIVRISLWRDALDLLPALVPTLSTDQRVALDARLDAAQGRDAIIAGVVDDSSNLLGYTPTRLNTAWGRIARPWVNANLTLAMTDTLPLLEALMAIRDPAAAVAPSQMSVAPPPPSKVPLLYREGERLREGFYTSVGMALERQAAHEASLRVARVALALWQQRDTSNGLPENLNELIPQLGPLAVLDPFTQKPLIYRRFGNSFVLYSAGPNGIDDQSGLGRPEDDIVWNGN
jgi:hypothetical protein